MIENSLIREAQELLNQDFWIPARVTATSDAALSIVLQACAEALVARVHGIVVFSFAGKTIKNGPRLMRVFARAASGQSGYSTDGNRAPFCVSHVSFDRATKTMANSEVASAVLFHNTAASRPKLARPLIADSAGPGLSHALFAVRSPFGHGELGKFMSVGLTRPATGDMPRGKKKISEKVVLKNPLPSGPLAAAGGAPGDARMLGDDARDAGFDDDDDVAGAAVANTAGKYTTADFLFYSLAKLNPAAASAIRDTIDAAIRALNKNLCEHVPIMSWKYDVAANGHSKFCDTATAALKAVLGKIQSDPQYSTARATVVNFAERSVAKFTTAAAAAALSLGPDRQRYDSAATFFRKRVLAG
jgi:hypothetical protein